MASPSPALEKVQAVKTTFDFDPGIDRELRRLIRKTTARAISYFAIPRPEDRQTPSYIIVWVNNDVAPDGLRSCGISGFTGDIAIYAQSGCFQDFGAVERKATLVHETFHAVQDAFFGKLVVLPPWIVEGSAAYATADALDRWGLRSYGASRDQFLQRPTGSVPSLKDLARGSTWAEERVDGEVYDFYSVSFFAIEHLVKDRGGWRRVLHFLDEVSRRGEDHWRVAFKHTFGMKIGRFYRRFAAFRERGFSR